MTTMVYGRQGEPLQVEPVEPVAGTAMRPRGLKDTSSPLDRHWRPHFEIAHASNQDLEWVIMHAAKELADRVSQNAYPSEEYDRLHLIVIGCKR